MRSTLNLGQPGIQHILCVQHRSKYLGHTCYVQPDTKSACPIVPCGIPPHMTPFHHLWTKSLILSHDWSISLSHLTPYDPLRPHINWCTCCWSVLSLVPCGIPPHMTPFHPLRTLFGISNQHIVCSISYPHPLWPPKTPYQPQSLECFSFPTPYDPLSPPMNLISYIESWPINLSSLPHPIWHPKTT